MNIVVNVRSLGAQTTGVQRYTRELLDRFGNEVTVVAPDRHLSGARGHLWEQVVLPQRIGSRVLWSPSNTGPIALERQVVTIHDVTPIDHPEWQSPAFVRWYRFMFPRLARRARVVLTDSEFSRGRIIETLGADPARVHAVPLGVDERFGVVTPGEIQMMRQALRLPGARYVLSLGSLEPRKNLPRLLAAWSRLVPELDDDTWLLLAGARGPSSVFRGVGLERMPPRVHATGFVPDALLPALYAGATVFAYPSLYEGFGLPPLEAMRAGVATVVSNCASLPEVVGNDALAVDPLDVDGLADAIRRLMHDDTLRTRLSELGRLRAASFTWERTAQRTRALLARAAAS